MAAARRTRPRPARPAAAAPTPGKPGLLPPRWAKVGRVRLIRREVRESLGPGALDLLLEHAELVVEGSQEIATADPGRRIYATVMVTIDLMRCAERVREPADAATAERIAELLREQASLRSRLAALARPHLARLAGLAPDALELAVEIHVRSEGVHVLIDGDAVAWPRAGRRG